MRSAPRSAAIAAASAQRGRQHGRLGEAAVAGAEHVGGGDRDARVDQHHAASRQRRRHASSSPTPPIRAGSLSQADRHVGAEPERDGGELRRRHGQAPQPVQQPQRRRRIGRAAADPAGDRQVLVQHDPRPARGAPAAAASARAARSTRLSPPSAPRRTARSTSSVSVVGRLGLQRVGRAGKHGQTVQQMIAVGPAPEHVQEQVDLGGRRLGSHRLSAVRRLPDARGLRRRSGRQRGQLLGQLRFASSALASG